MQERKKLTMVKAQAYLKAGKAKKSVMLDDFCESTEYCRRHAARVLHQAVRRYLQGGTILASDSTKRLHRQRPPRYDPLVQQALIAIWAASTFFNSVRLAGGMLIFVENPITHRDPHIDDDTRSLLIQMSLATIGRFLVEERSMYCLHGICHARNAPLAGGIPAQTCMNPSLDVPGVLAVDLVGHDGGQQWVTLAVDPRSHGLFHAADRSRGRLDEGGDLCGRRP